MVTIEDVTDRIRAVLADIPDPEIPAVSIVDLGIVRAVTEREVRITPTYSGCPATLAIELAIRTALDCAGFGDVAIRNVLAPAWTTDWITPEGHVKVKEYGIAPPSSGPVECPRCGSANTREISRFGSTPCKAQWQCRDCSEPFDRFKCH